MAGAAREVLSAREHIEELAEELAAAMADSEMSPSVASRRAETAAKLFAAAAGDSRRALALAEGWKAAMREIEESTQEETAAMERAREATAASRGIDGVGGGGGGGGGLSSWSARRRRVPPPMPQEPVIIREAAQPASPGTPSSEQQQRAGSAAGGGEDKGEEHTEEHFAEVES